MTWSIHIILFFIPSFLIQTVIESLKIKPKNTLFIFDSPDEGQSNNRYRGLKSTKQSFCIIEHTKMGFCLSFKRITWFFLTDSFDEKYYANTNYHYPKYGWAYSNNYSQLHALSWGILGCGGVCCGFFCAGGEFILFWKRIK